jgi:hypothetical protein
MRVLENASKDLNEEEFLSTFKKISEYLNGQMQV